MNSYFSHSANAKGDGWAEPMAEHVAPVAMQAKLSSAIFQAGDEANVMSLLHDIGKYSFQFQQRLLDPVNVTGIDHWTLGALLALKQYSELGIGVACAIAGHHVGLSCPVFSIDRQAIDRKIHRQIEQLGETSVSDIVSRFHADGFKLINITESIYDPIGGGDVAQMLNVRFLFSSLVDADFIETEAHFAGDVDIRRRYRPKGGSFDLSAARVGLESHLKNVASKSNAEGEVNQLRQMLSDSCGKPGRKNGLYTLTAPTGSGKTLSMLRFALQHAEDRAQTDSPIRRIINVLPFLSIIDQTAAEYQEVLKGTGNTNLLQDHSLSEQRVHEHASADGVEEEMRTRRLLAQNWDAPFIITTTVQFFESLFGNRPSGCRKLHNIANSVILLDEVQTLPPKLLIATLAAVSQLVTRFNCTVVLATATQPAFEHLSSEVSKQCPAGWAPDELNESCDEMFKLTSTRTRVKWRLEGCISWQDLASEIVSSDERHVLAVVNLKQHALKLTEALLSLSKTDDCDIFHISTNLCPAHRKSVIRFVKDRLREKARPVYLVATQCIEAGVDVSFQKAYRALAPLEAIAQVAGRCNRGGEYGKECEVIVFRPTAPAGDRSLYPPGYQSPTEATELFVKSLAPEVAEKVIHMPEEIKRYYRALYDLTRNVKPKKEFAEALAERDFEKVAAEYQLIPNDTVRVLVPFDKDVFDRLKAEQLRDEGIDSIRQWVAAATPLSVSVHRSKGLTSTGLQSVCFRRGTADDIADWYVLIDKEKYDVNRKGLLDLEANWIY